MPPRVAAIHPLWAIEGGRLTIEGADFPGPPFPEVRIGALPARVVYASSTRLTVLVPPGLEGGRAAIRIAGVTGETPLVDIAAPFATGLHQVDNPVFDREGNLYLTYTRTRRPHGPV